MRARRPTRRQWMLAVAVVPAGLLLYTLLLVPFTPGISDIRKAKQEQPAQILSADGKEMALFRRANRDWVPLDQISPQVVAALVSTEDHRFYQHFGLDWRRTASAALQTVAGDRQGGSTITQQLARNLYPDEIGRAPTFTRKLKEAITALKIEALYTKDEILETYLNTVPFLYNAYGIEMAARTYFDKPARQLDVVESATLIGMLKGTSYYNPVQNPERALERRNIVLAQMVKRGELTQARYDALKKRPLQVDFERQTEPNGPAPHFALQLRKWLISWADAHDYNIYTDGLIVHTTLDSRLQTQATQAVQRQGARLQGVANAVWSSRGGWNSNSELVRAFVRETREYRAARDGGQDDAAALRALASDAAFMRTLREQKTRIQAGFVAMDPTTGAIRAWVGSRDFSEDAFDHVQSAQRQPGSTFKPFVYGEAFRQGMRAEDTIVDQAVEIALPGGEVWRPRDGGPPSGRPMTLRDGLVYSRNTITAQLMQQTGPARVAQLARDMGVRQSRLDVVPSLALGTSPVTLKEMVAAYGTIASGGIYRAPFMVTRIEDRNGQVLAEFAPPQGERALAVGAAQVLRDVMRDAVDRGTGMGVRSRYGVRGDVAGKTGTTQDNADGWFILMHPQLVGGAWVGFNDSRVTLRSDYWGQGAHSALPIVGDVFQRAQRARILDTRQRFEDVEESNYLADAARHARSWWNAWFADERAVMQAPAPARRPRTDVTSPAGSASDAVGPPVSGEAATLPADPVTTPAPTSSDNAAAGNSEPQEVSGPQIGADPLGDLVNTLPQGAPPASAGPPRSTAPAPATNSPGALPPAPAAAPAASTSVLPPAASSAPVAPAVPVPPSTPATPGR